MSGIVRLTDLCTGHGCYPARSNVEASTNSIVNNLGIHRVGDNWETHGCGTCVPHGAIQATGSPNVSVNDRPIARVGDNLSCGSMNATGSSNSSVN